MLPKKHRLVLNTIFVLVILLLGSSTIKPYLPTEIQQLFEPTPTAKQAYTTTIPSVTPALSVTTSANASSQTVYETIVVKVIDGDTVEIAGGQKLRYIGINAPESVDPRRPIQCFGKEASEKNRLLIEGKTVRLEKDVSETDRFGRLLRYVYIEDVMINELLVKEGYAIASAYPPDVKYQDRLKLAENEARSNNHGLWKDCKK